MLKRKLSALSNHGLTCKLEKQYSCFGWCHFLLSVCVWWVVSVYLYVFETWSHKIQADPKFIMKLS